MKRVLSLILALMMILSAVMLASCSKDEKTPESEEAKTSEASKQSEGNKTEGQKETDPAVPSDVPKEESKTPLPEVNDNVKAVNEAVVGGINDIFGIADKVMKTGMPSLSNGIGADAEVKIECSEQLPALLKMILGDAANAIDISFFKNASFKLSFDMAETAVAAQLKALLNDKEIIAAQVVADLSARKVAVQVPLISDKYFELPVEQILQMITSIGSQKEVLHEYPEYGDDFEEYIDDEYIDDEYPVGEYPDDAPVTGNVGVNIEQIMEIVGKVLPVLPDAKTVKGILTRYIAIVLNSLTDVVVENADLTAGGVTKTVKKTTVTLTPDALLTVVKNLGTALKEDAEIAKIASDVCTALGMSAEQAQAMLSARIDEMLAGVSEEIPEDVQGKTLPIAIYTDDGKFCGLELTYEGKGVRVCAVTKDDAIGAELSYVDTDPSKCISLTLTGSAANKVINADVAISMAGEKLFGVKIEGFDLKALENGAFVGKFSINVGEILNFAEMVSGPNESLEPIKEYAKNIALCLEGTKDGQTQTVKFAVVYGVTELLSIFGSLTLRDAGAVAQLPAAQSFEEFSQTLDPNALIEKLFGALVGAGVPQELIAQLTAKMQPAEPDGPLPEQTI